AYFLEALGALSGTLDERALRALVEGIEEENQQAEASRAAALYNILPTLVEWKMERQTKIQDEYLRNKKVLLDQLITLRTQQLYEQEKNLLQRLQKLYPHDSEILLEAGEHRQRHALEILQRHSPKSSSRLFEDLDPRDPEVEKALAVVLQSLHEQASRYPDMCFDFAVAAFMLEAYEEALSLLSQSEVTSALLWFRLEILLQCRRFVELLSELAQVEVLFAEEPETFFATAYLRAQALWGLGQKHTAMEVLEGLLAARPHYRAASTLMSLWRGP
ncbi:MAG: hypothetical protein AAGB31_15080, partial [Bdellovibrio sp.]